MVKHKRDGLSYIKLAYKNISIGYLVSQLDLI
jgi:hypothetical protein